MALFPVTLNDPRGVFDILALYKLDYCYYYYYYYWKYKMQVGTTLNLCDQRPADSRAAKWR